jgi:hypothetical protein
MKRLKEPERDNPRPRRALSDPRPEKIILKDAASGR